MDLKVPLTFSKKTKQSKYEIRQLEIFIWKVIRFSTHYKQLDSQLFFQFQPERFALRMCSYLLTFFTLFYLFDRLSAFVISFFPFIIKNYLLRGFRESLKHEAQFSRLKFLNKKLQSLRICSETKELPKMLTISSQISNHLATPHINQVRHDSRFHSFLQVWRCYCCETFFC